MEINKKNTQKTEQQTVAAMVNDDKQATVTLNPLHARRVIQYCKSVDKKLFVFVLKHSATPGNVHDIHSSMMHQLSTSDTLSAHLASDIMRSSANNADDCFSVNNDDNNESEDDDSEDSSEVNCLLFEVF